MILSQNWTFYILFFPQYILQLCFLHLHIPAEAETQT